MSSVSVRPASADPVAWKAYWRATGALWRTEPEIDGEQQKYLLERLAIGPNIEQGVYPYKDVRLTRADIEWLLANHQDGKEIGPISGATEDLHLREGIDLRGAWLWGLDLSALPLACARFGLSFDEWGQHKADKSIGEDAAAHLECVTFYHADLRGATFCQGHLEGANFLEARLEGAFLREAHLGHRNLKLKESKDPLDKRVMIDKQLMSDPEVEERLQPDRHDKRSVPGKPARSSDILPAASLHLAYFDASTALNDLTLGESKSYVRLADARWNGANLAVVPALEHVSRIGDETLALDHARDRNDAYFKAYHRIVDDMPRDRQDAYLMATRANQQLSEMLRGQGINQLADRFAYRSKVCERNVLARQRRVPSVLISFTLDILAGYGYHFWKSFLWYIGIIAAFAAAYFSLGEKETWQMAVKDSIYAFHGGAVIGFHSVGMEAIAFLPFAETLIGFIIAATFIAVYTQRFLSK